MEWKKKLREWADKFYHDILTTKKQRKVLFPGLDQEDELEELEDL